MDLVRKLQYTSLALVLFAMAYIIYGWFLIAYVWLFAGFAIWLTGGTRYKVWKISIFWLIAIWIDPVSEWMLDSDVK